MNAITVQPKTIEVQPARTANYNFVTWRTADDPFNRKLQIIVNNQAVIVVSGADYDALGQWSDADVRRIVFEKFGFVEV